MWAVTFAPLYCVAVPLGLLVMRKAPAHPAAPGAFGAGRFFKTLLITVFLMYAGNILGTIITAALGALLGDEVANPLLNYALDDGSIVLKALVLAVLAPIIEEFVFRKTLIDRMRVYGEKLAVVTSALMFALFHGNLSQFFYALLLGLVFGYVYLRTGRLRYSAALHMFVNFTGSVLAPALLERAGLDALENVDLAQLTADPAAAEALATPGLIAFVVYVVLLFVLSVAGLVLLCANARRVEFESAERELPKAGRFRVVWVNVGMLLFVVACFVLIAMSLFM